MPVLTISGQPGAGAHEVGRLVAGHLDIDYVDQEILVEAARELGVPVQAVVTHDERTAGLGERLANMLRRFLESSAAAGTGDPMFGTGGLDAVLSRSYAEAAADEGAHEISDEQYLKALRGIVEDLAEHDNVVIIGRGSQVILRDYPVAVHVLLVAPLEQRIAATAARDSVSAEAAEKRVHERDKGRSSFHSKFFKVEVDAAALYHVALNTGRLSYEQAADAITVIARGRTRA